MILEIAEERNTGDMNNGEWRFVFSNFSQHRSA